MIMVGLFNGNEKLHAQYDILMTNSMQGIYFRFYAGFFFLATAETTYVTLSNDRSIVDYKAIVYFYVKK